jgi:2-polyprenyl-6-methoxyphenol hydroxylase-like FAD-dependent oxidoreductase
LEGITSEERKQRLLELFRGDQPFIRNIIRAAETTFPDFPSYAIPKQRSWHQGPVVLLGDAAHAISPSSGQGASMALEDAVVLAKCLRDISNLEQAFGTYEHLRRERTEQMYEVGVKQDSGKFASGHPMQAWFRDLMTPFFLKRVTPESLEWLYSYRVDWNTPIEARTSEVTESQKIASPISVAK